MFTATFSAFAQQPYGYFYLISCHIFPDCVRHGRHSINYVLSVGSDGEGEWEVHFCVRSDEAGGRRETCGGERMGSQGSDLLNLYRKMSILSSRAGRRKECSRLCVGSAVYLFLRMTHSNIDYSLGLSFHRKMSATCM